MDKKQMRYAYGQALMELGSINPNVVSIDADVSTSTKSVFFAQKFPERAFNVGIAELHMCAMAAGMAASGKIPFINSFAIFLSSRGADAIHSLIAQDSLNVKIAASYSGYSGGKEGVSHQSINDIANLRSMPNMTVVVACDFAQAKKAVFAVAEHEGPVYLRLLKTEVPDVYNGDFDFEIGKANQLKEGNDISIIATGSMVYYALEAAKVLNSEGVSARVIDMHTIKPLDENTVLKAAKETGAILTVEEHNVIGGLGGAVAECLAKTLPTPMEIVGIQDFFSESGDYEDLLDLADLTVSNIVNKSQILLKRKAL